MAFGSKLRQILKQRWRPITIVILGCALIFFIVAGYWLQWTRLGFLNKTLWDWMQLLIVPALLTLGAVWFASRQNHDREIAREQHEHDTQIAVDNQREVALQGYIDHMSELLLEKNLRASKPDDEVRNIASVRTLTAFSILDPRRKRNILQFLKESGLINKGSRIIGLSEADLSSAHLSKANLVKVDLSNTILNGADLSEANLSEADLSNAHLKEANLSEAMLEEADLRETDLWGANLKNAIFYRANLTHANLSVADLSGTYMGGAKLINSLLDATILSNANLSSANLRGSVLYQANLCRADLKGADLSKANLFEVDLSEADLHEADLSEANLLKAKVAAEQLDKAKSLKGATMPDGTIHS